MNNENFSSPVPIQPANALLLDKVIYISRKINSFYDLPQLLDAIMETATEIIEAEAASVLLLDEKKENLIFYSVVGEKKEAVKQFTVPANQGIAGYAVQNQEPVMVNDAKSDKRFYKLVDENTQFETRSIIAFPLIVKNETIGVLEVINALSHHGFEEKDMKVLSYISELSALAIYNRVLYDNLIKNNRVKHKRVQELNALYSLLNSFSMSMDKVNLRDIFKQAAKIIEGTLECSRVSIFLLYEEKKNYFEMVSAVGLDAEEMKEGQIIALSESKIMKLAVEHKKPVYVLSEDNTNFSFNTHYLSEEKYQSRFFISLPIMKGDEIIGFINATDKQSEDGIDSFDDFDFSLIKSIALTLSNIYSQYQANVVALNQKIINRELETAGNIQKKMLQQSFPDFNPIRGFGLNIPARNVSGDFYGAEKISDNLLAAYVGDVSGKGLPAAFFMATARTSFKEKIKFYQQPQIVLKELNNTLFNEIQDGMFVTLAYFLINRETSQIHYSFAGHNRQFLFEAKTKTTKMLKTPGKPIGIMYDIDFNCATCSFESGDILVLFTDGVTEALINNQEEEGEKLIQEILKSSYGLEPEEITKLIKSVFLEEGKELFDDFTLLVIKF